MIETGKISIRQLTILVTIFTIGSSILVAPSGIALGAKQDAWIAAILGTAIASLFVWLHSVLGKQFPGLTLAQYCESILGKWPGMAAALLFSSYFFIVAAISLREISDFITTQIMPDTPIHFIHILYLTIVIFALQLGLETLTRAAEIFFPWVIMLFFLLVILLTPLLDIQKLQPVMGYGIKPVLKGMFPFLGLPYLELVVFLMIIPYVNQSQRAGKALLIGTIIGGTVLIITSALSILVLGGDFTARNTYPSYTLAKKISVGNFLERLEVIMAGIWFLSLYFKLTLCFYASVLALGQTLRLRGYRPLLLPLGMIMMMFSLFLSPNITYFRAFLHKIWTPFSFTYGVFLPLILLIVARIRKKKLASQEGDFATEGGGHAGK